MNTLKRVLGTLVASLFIFSLALVAGATASSAGEPNNIDREKDSARVNCFSKAAMYSTFVRTFGKGHYKGSGKNN